MWFTLRGLDGARFLRPGERAYNPAWFGRTERVVSPNLSESLSTGSSAADPGPAEQVPPVSTSAGRSPLAAHAGHPRHTAGRAQIEDDLWLHGFRVLKGALRTGAIVTMCREAGVPLTMTDEHLRTLHSSIEDREELTVETLLRAVPYFRQKVLEAGRWDPTRSTKHTFFIGCCLRAFGGVFARWVRARKVRLGELGFGLSESTLDQALLRRTSTSPEATAGHRDTLRTIMKYARPEARMICFLILRDLTYAEIGERLDGISARAVEGHMSRLRRTVGRLARRGQIDPLQIPGRHSSTLRSTDA